MVTDRHGMSSRDHRSSLRYGAPTAAGDVRRVPDDDVDGDEGWDRLTDDGTLAVEAIRTDELGRYRWQIYVGAMEFVREEPLEQQLRSEIHAALVRIAGVEEVLEQDREMWALAGAPDGAALVRAAADVLDSHGAEVRYAGF